MQISSCDCSFRPVEIVDSRVQLTLMLRRDQVFGHDSIRRFLILTARSYLPRHRIPHFGTDDTCIFKLEKYNFSEVNEIRLFSWNILLHQDDLCILMDSIAIFHWSEFETDPKQKRGHIRRAGPGIKIVRRTIWRRSRLLTGMRRTRLRIILSWI